MKTLILMRHALAGHARRDYERPLENRGREQGALQGVRMKADIGDIDLAFVSGATRTVQTLNALRSVGLQVNDVQEMPALYSGSWSDVVKELEKVDDTVHTLLVLGHEPTMSVLSSMLASEDSKTEVTFGFGFSTAQYVWGTVQAWSQLTQHSFHIAGVARPAL